MTNGVFAAGSYSVVRPLVSNLIAAAKRPWPQASTNVWPPFTIDLGNLGLNAAWVRSNYQRMLESFVGESNKSVFPNASERQRVWLTNALADANVVGESLRGCFGTSWTDDYPGLELRLESENGRAVKQVLRLSTRAQQSFMLPWHVFNGTNQTTSGNADISRAVVQVLPPGFMHRDRLSGDLPAMIVGQFPSLSQVQEFMKKSTLEETLGTDAGRLLQDFELRDYWTHAGGYNRFPDTFTTALHRTNWPARFTMPIQAGIELGVAKNLKTLLGNAQARVAPLLKQEWLVSRLKGGGDISVGVMAEGSPDHQWLHGHMDKAGRAAFYDRIRPSLRRSLGFVLREGTWRSSEWALLEDGRLLLYGFTGNGVLDWKPDELGLQGDPRTLQSLSINRIGVFVGPEGTITEVVMPEKKSL